MFDCLSETRNIILLTKISRQTEKKPSQQNLAMHRSRGLKHTQQAETNTINLQNNHEERNKQQKTDRYKYKLFHKLHGQPLKLMLLELYLTYVYNAVAGC